MNEKDIPSEKEWREKLSLEQFHILREKGTERAFSGEYWDHYKTGQYRCAGCGAILFSSDAKFESNCGWPSFSTSVDNVIDEQTDLSHGMKRIEVMCKKCRGHLGHVFEDGPKERGGLRYCINSISLKFEEK